MEEIILDTNFLRIPFESRIDVASELLRICHGPFSIIIPNGVLLELSAQAGKKGPQSLQAKSALNYVEHLRKRFRIEVVQSDGPVDNWIIKHAQKNGICVATNDVPLRKKLRALGVPVISLKGESRLEFV